MLQPRDRADDHHPLMIGFSIHVFRQFWPSDRSRPATFGAEEGRTLAYWVVGGFGGLDWVRELVHTPAVVGLGGNGYPVEYTAQLKVVRDYLLGSIPIGRGGPVVISDDDGSIAVWPPRRNEVHPLLIAACPDDEWVHIRAFDQS
ncbi:hypothetical protein K0B96_16060 [Horticoccus luteus]|uniref:Uncharacterized protein n=1 Tax=Horticoccus luteus TaxID=2862869 RepID=A0A8F9TWE6_9BACT|nr:hypothetical protein [Horticoccus luteus]QYM78797.1 hypothetical protein K0B96_16060 [Horticoccus luteus]